MTLREAAVAEGMKIARGIFALRGNHSEIHLSEQELASILALAFEHGAKAVALRTLKGFSGAEAQSAGGAKVDLPCIGGHDDLAAQRARDQEIANARLIAAAPQLLSALKAIMADGRIRNHEPLGVEAWRAIWAAERGPEVD